MQTSQIHVLLLPLLLTNNSSLLKGCTVQHFELKSRISTGFLALMLTSGAQGSRDPPAQILLPLVSLATLEGTRLTESLFAKSGPINYLLLHQPS